jgi:hypothetical protein
MSSLDLLCFDVLGEYVDPQRITVAADRSKVFVKWPPSMPKALIPQMLGDWKAETEGTQFEGTPVEII